MPEVRSTKDSIQKGSFRAPRSEIIPESNETIRITFPPVCPIPTNLCLGWNHEGAAVEELDWDLEKPLDGGDDLSLAVLGVLEQDGVVLLEEELNNPTPKNIPYPNETSIKIISNKRIGDHMRSLR